MLHFSQTFRSLILYGGLCLCLASLAVAVHAKDPQTNNKLIGTWILDPEKSTAVQPENVEQRNWFKDNNVQTSVNVGGMPLPKLRRRVPPISSHAEVDPGVLRCKKMTIAAVEQDLEFTYADVGSERRKQGHYRGVDTKWNNKSLSESYKTTTRKVKQKYELTKTGELLVTVIINPHKGAKRTYKQVFRRES